MKKQQIIEILIEELFSRLEVLERRISDIDTSAASAPSSIKDEDSYYKESLCRTANMFSQRARGILETINEIKKFQPKDQSEVVLLGSLVTVNMGGVKRLLFSVPCTEDHRAGGCVVEMNGEKILIVSNSSPLYREIREKRSGDQVIFNNNKIIIEEIR